jgi:hypothetical protein
VRCGIEDEMAIESSIPDARHMQVEVKSQSWTEFGSDLVVGKVQTPACRSSHVNFTATTCRMT